MVFGLYFLFVKSKRYSGCNVSKFEKENRPLASVNTGTAVPFISTVTLTQAFY